MWTYYLSHGFACSVPGIAALILVPSDPHPPVSRPVPCSIPRRPQAGPTLADRPRLADSLLAPDGGGGGGMAAGDPFPNIVRLTEAKLQEAYQLLVRERRRGTQLTKQAREAARRVRLIR